MKRHHHLQALRRLSPALFLPLFWLGACSDVSDGNDRDFNDEDGGSGGDQTEEAGGEPAGPGRGGSGGREQMPGGAGGQGGVDGGDGRGGDGGLGDGGVIGIGGGGAPGDGPAPPCISALYDRTIPYGTIANDINVTLSDPDTSLGDLQLSAVSSNTDLVRSVEGIQLEGSLGWYWLHVTPELTTGKTTITLTVSDGELQNSSSFELTVTDSPILSGAFDMGSVKNVPLNFRIDVSDDLTPLDLVDVTATSSNTALLPDAGIDIVNNGYSRYFTLNFAADQLGATTVTVTADDDDPNSAPTTVSFEVTVVESPVNDAELVSRASDPGPIGDSYSDSPSFSSDGRYVAFGSSASNLVPGDTSGSDAFVWDRQSKMIQRVSPGTGQSGNPVISGDGTTVAFWADSQLIVDDSDDTYDVYVVELDSNLPELVSVRDDGGPEVTGGNSTSPSISQDGRFVSFTSYAALVDGDDNGQQDVYVRDRTLGTTTRVTVSSSGVGANDNTFQSSISADGGLIAFDSIATNLIDGVVDTAGKYDVFLRSGGVTKRLSQNPQTLEPGNGGSIWPRVSADGSVVVFDSAASNLTGCDGNGQGDIFAYILASDTIELVSVPSDEFPAGSVSMAAAVSGDGRYVVFHANASVPTGRSGNHTYIRDRLAGTTKLVDRSYSGHYPTYEGMYAAISGDGAFVAFASGADNIVLLDDNLTMDVFVVPRP